MRRLAGSQQARSNASAASGEPAMVSRRRKAAKSASPSNCARSRLSVSISRINGAFSRPGVSAPRAAKARHSFSRKSRRAEKVRKGSAEERERVKTKPSTPCAMAASRAASRAKAGRPSKSASVSTRRQSFSSANTFWPKAVCSVASRVEIAASRARAFSSSPAPARVRRR